MAILLAAAALRLTLLSIKPPHFDEGVNGWFVDQITHTGFYHYDPTNYHGPFHFYVLFLCQTLLGRHIWALRLPLALAGVGAVWLTLRFDRFIGRGAARWAAAAMAVSPGCVFYSRYAIHENWLVLALMLCAWGLAGLWQSGARKYLWALWIGITLAVLTKETYVIHFGCAALTFACVWLLGTISPHGGGEAAGKREWSARDMILGSLMFAGCVLFFYSGTFMDLPGLKGLYQTYGAWVHTGQTGNGHEKVWYYWLQLFGQYEWFSCVGLVVAFLCTMPRMPFGIRVPLAVVLAAFGACSISHDIFLLYGVKILPFISHLGTPCYIVAPLCLVLILAVLFPLSRPPRVIRALAIYGCGALAAYSIVHYKTPWCIVSLTWPFLFLFGYGVDFACQKFGSPVAVVSATILIANLCDTIYLNFFHFTDQKQPYVYVQTYSDIDKLMNPLNTLIFLNPANYQIKGHIILDSYHPLPWLLGDFPNIGYYDDNTTPPQMDADFLLVEETRVDQIEAGLHNSYFTDAFKLRDAQEKSKLYLSAKKFQALFPDRTPEFVPEPQPSPSSPAKPGSSATPPTVATP